MPKATVYNKGSIIYFDGEKDERIFILQRGTIMLTSIDIETKRSSAVLLKEGEFFGIKSALGKCPREETVTVVEQATCIVLTVPEFERFFSTNKPLIMKMLRIFSKELKMVHKKTSGILKLNDGKPSEAISVDDGLYDVAKSFFEEEKWQSCLDACTRLIKESESYRRNSEIVQMVKKCTAQVQIEKKEEDNARNRLIVAGEYREFSNNGLPNDYQSDAVEKAFDMPAFSRFAKTWSNGEIIIAEFEKGETFYLIQRGLVQLTKCVNGRNKNLDILNPGEIFGEMAILDNSPRSATCVAKGSVDCLEFNKGNFEALVTGSPQIALKLLRLFCKRILDQKRRLRILILDENYAKIADVFCMFEESKSLPPVLISEQDDEGPMTRLKEKQLPYRRAFPLSISDLAHWSGLTVDEARAEADKMSKGGVIKIYDGYIIIPDIRDMKRVVENRLKIMDKKAAEAKGA